MNTKGMFMDGSDSVVLYMACILDKIFLDFCHHTWYRRMYCL